MSTGNDRGGNGIPSAEKTSRTLDENPVCYRSNQPGHIKQFCKVKFETTGSAGESSPKQGAGAVPSPLVSTVHLERPLPLVNSMSELSLLKKATGQEDFVPNLLPGIFQIDFSRMFTMEVVCVSGIRTALIDTGASISVMTPNAVSELGLDCLVEP